MTQCHGRALYRQDRAIASTAWRSPGQRSPRRHLNAATSVVPGGDPGIAIDGLDSPARSLWPSGGPANGAIGSPRFRSRRPGGPRGCFRSDLGSRAGLRYGAVGLVSRAGAARLLRQSRAIKDVVAGVGIKRPRTHGPRNDRRRRRRGCAGVRLRRSGNTRGRAGSSSRRPAIERSRCREDGITPILAALCRGPRISAGRRDPSGWLVGGSSDNRREGVPRLTSRQARRWSERMPRVAGCVTRLSAGRSRACGALGRRLGMPPWGLPGVCARVLGSCLRQGCRRAPLVRGA